MEHRMRSCVCGYHGYQRVREAVVGKKLECERETRNVKVRNAVVAKKAKNYSLQLNFRVFNIRGFFRPRIINNREKFQNYSSLHFTVNSSAKHIVASMVSLHGQAAKKGLMVKVLS